MELKTRIEMHSFNKYLLSTYYVLATVLGSGDEAENKRESLPSWCSHAGGGQGQQSSKQINTMLGGDP